MIWVWLACTGPAPTLGPGVWPAATHATSAALADYAVPLGPPTRAELDGCADGLAGRAILEIRPDAVVLRGQTIASAPPDGFDGAAPFREALQRLTDDTRAAGACVPSPGRLLVAADARVPASRVFALLYAAGQAEFGQIDVLVADPTPDGPGPHRGETAWIVEAKRATLAVRAVGADAGPPVARADLATALGAGPIDVTLSLAQDQPFGDWIGLHDVVAGRGGRVAYGMQPDLPAAPTGVGGAPGPWALGERVSILRLHSPAPGDGWLVEVDRAAEPLPSTAELLKLLGLAGSPPGYPSLAGDPPSNEPPP